MLEKSGITSVFQIEKQWFVHCAKFCLHTTAARAPCTRSSRENTVNLKNLNTQTVHVVVRDYLKDIAKEF